MSLTSTTPWRIEADGFDERHQQHGRVCNVALSSEGGVLVKMQISVRFAWYRLETHLEGMEDQVRVWAVEVEVEGQLWARHGWSWS